MSDLYLFNVSMYLKPPQESSTIGEQINMARERLKLYKIFKKNEFATPEKIQDLLRDSCFKHLLNENRNSIDARKIDYYSHWILRHVYSTQYEKFFIECEKKWFTLRYNCMKNFEKEKFLESENLTQTPVSTKELNKMRIDLKVCYRLKFTEAPHLLPSRKYSCHKGYFYIPPEAIIQWLLFKLEKSLKSSLSDIKKALPLSNNAQIKMILSCIKIVEPINYKFNPKTERVTLKTLNQEAKLNFPVCMRFHHDYLRQTHHLKYFSRMQYGLFIKALGLTLEESLDFWRDEFMHDMSEDKFNKKYSYLFKHHYGEVGSKINQGPYSCEKIFQEGTNNTGANNQICGCPFVLWNEELLKSKLEEYEVPATAIPEIIKLKREQKYNLACTKCLEAYHDCEGEDIIKHPNQYFERSRQLRQIADIEDLGDFLDSD